MNQLLDVEGDFDETVARLRRDLPELAAVGGAQDDARPSLEAVLARRGVLQPADDLADRRRQRSGAQRWWLAAAAAVTVAALGITIWQSEDPTTGPTIADTTRELPAYEVLPGEIVVSTDPLIVVLADPVIEVDGIGLEIDQPVTAVEVDGTRILDPAQGWVEAVNRFAFEHDVLGHDDAVETVAKTTVAGVSSNGNLLHRTDGQQLLADGSRFYFLSSSAAGMGDEKPIDRGPWHRVTSFTTSDDAPGRIVLGLGGLGDAVAVRIVTPDDVVTAGVAGGMAEIDAPIVEQHTRVQIERLLPDGTWDLMLRDAGVLGLTGPDRGATDVGQGTTLDDLAPPPGVVTVYGAEWCVPCNDLEGFVADVEAAREAVGEGHVKVLAIAATAEEWPAADVGWPYASGIRNAAVGQIAPFLPWVVITDADGRAIYSGGLPSESELEAAFEVIVGE